MRTSSALCILYFVSVGSVPTSKHNTRIRVEHDFGTEGVGVVEQLSANEM